MKRIKAKGRRRRRRRWWEHGAHRRPPNLVKNFAVSLVFQARLHFGAEHRGRDIERGGEGGGRLDDAPLLFFLRFAFPRFPMPSFGRRNYFQVFIQFAGEEGERQEDWQEAARIERESRLVSPTSLPPNIVRVFAYYYAPKGFVNRFGGRRNSSLPTF